MQLQDMETIGFWPAGIQYTYINLNLQCSLLTEKEVILLIKNDLRALTLLRQFPVAELYSFLQEIVNTDFKFKYFKKVN